MLILNTLAPVFLLIAAGAGLQAAKFVSPDFLKEANRVTYWLGLPALLFSQLSGSFHHSSGAGRMFLVTLLGTVLVIFAGYAIAWLMKIPGPAIGTFVQGGYRGNLAFVGLPVIFSLPDTAIFGGMSARTAAVLTVAPIMVFYNIAGVVVLLLSQHRLGWAMVKPFVKQLATTPPLLATLAGISYAMLGWTLPPFLDKALSSLGEMALPLGLLGVGGSLITVKLGSSWRSPLASALVKTAVSPLIGWLVARAAGVDGMELKMILLLMACPTAIVSYTMAIELKGDERLAAGAIALSVLTSVVSLAVVVGMF